MTDTGFELSTNVADTMNLMSDLSLQNRSIGSGAGLMNQVMSFAGLSDAKGLNLLFSPVIDKAIDNVLDMFITGNFDAVLSKLDNISNVLANGGVGEGLFTGEISQRIIASIKNSMQSYKFNKTGSKIKKALIVLKNLKAQAKQIVNPETRKKFEDAMYALNAILKTLKSLYKNRKFVNDRLISGIHNLVKEDEDKPITLIKVTWRDE